MARSNQEAIETFMNIAGVSEATAIQKLQEHGGDLNEAVNAHFSEGDRNIIRETPVAATQDDAMDIDDPVQIEPQIPPFPQLSSNRNFNPFSLLDPNIGRGTDFVSRSPFVSHPREVREILIDFKDGNEQSGRSSSAVDIEDVTGTQQARGPEIHGTVVLDDDGDDEDVTTGPPTQTSRQTAVNDNFFGGYPGAPNSIPSAPVIDDYVNDIEERIRAAIEASKQDAELSDRQSEVLQDTLPHPQESPMEDTDLAQVVSLSLEMAERDKAIREREGEVGASNLLTSTDIKDNGKSSYPPNGRLHMGSSSALDEEAEEVEEQPLVRHRNRNASLVSGDTGQSVEGASTDFSTQSSHINGGNLNASQVNGNDFHSDEWGGISSEEHDEAVMLEAAMFGGIPEGSSYRHPFAPHQLMQNGLNRRRGRYGRYGRYPRYAPRMPRPPSPSLTAQRLLREQQDDEYLASLQADREKELKAKEAAEAVLAEERRKEEELQRKMSEEQEIDRQVAAKEASLPQEPSLDDENAVTLLVRMPDGSRRGRRFLKSDKLQCLFDFVDVSRVVKPGQYRLVRPYPRQAFSDGESASTLCELGLTGKQEALFLELI